MPRPKKSLGQNFLASPGIAARITRELDCGPEDNIIEIGPGRGALTQFIAQAKFKNFLLLEKDKDLAASQQAVASGNTQVLNIDALTFDWRRLEGDWKIIGNLPYNIASPLIWEILSQCVALKKAVFMVQKEVAQRLAASPGNKNYGALSVWAQSYAQVKYLLTVAPGNFYPAPKVDSAVVTFTPLHPDKRAAHPHELKKLLDLCFQNRRKQIGSIFKKYGLEAMTRELDRLGISANARPENLSPEQFNALSAHPFEHGI